MVVFSFQNVSPIGTYLPGRYGYTLTFCWNFFLPRIEEKKNEWNFLDIYT